MIDDFKNLRNGDKNERSVKSGKIWMCIALVDAYVNKHKYTLVSILFIVFARDACNGKRWVIYESFFMEGWWVLCNIRLSVNFSA